MPAVIFRAALFMNSTPLNRRQFLRLLPPVAAGVGGVACSPAARVTADGRAIVRFGHFPNVTHVQALVAHQWWRQGQCWFKQRCGVEIEWFIYTQTFSYILTTIITFLIVFRKAPFKRLTWNKAFFVLILKKSFPCAILVLLMTFYNRVDTVMLERILPNGATQSGIYASAYRLLDSANMISFLFAGLLLPMFARMLRHKESVEQLVKLAFTILLTPAIVITVACVFYNVDKMALLYKEHVYESAQVFSVLMGCFMATSVSYIFGTLLTANGNLFQLNMMAGSGMVFNLILNFVLIPKYMAEGAALSSLITQCITALLQVYLAQRIFKFKTNVRLLTQLFIFIPMVILLAYLSKLLVMNWFLGIILFSGTSIIFAFAIGLLHIKSIFRILKYG